MKKNIIIVVLALSTLFSIIYGMAQFTIAEKSKIIAEEQTEIAQQQVMIAEMSAHVAKEASFQAERAMAEAQIMIDSLRVASERCK